MAFVSSDLEVDRVERDRLILIRDVVKNIYNVNVVESNVTICSNKIVVSQSLNRKSSGGCLGKEDGQQQPTAVGSSRTAGQPEILSATLLFEGHVSVEEIEKAKNFARIHLLTGPHYTKSPHQLENQQEFNMVLESSQDIQTTTTALLTFDPQYLEVTFQGPSSNVALARSKVVGILDKYREQSRIDSNISGGIDFPGFSHKFNENLLLDNFVERQYNSESSDLSHLLINGPVPAEIIECKPKRNCASSNKVGQHGGVFQNKIQPHWHQAQSKIDGDEIECDATQSPISPAPVTSDFPPTQSGHGDSWRKNSLSSSDDESLSEENILTDLRYSKKIEQSLKLGYSEKQVKKALAKLGPECALNDLLSELIKLGSTDADLSTSQSLSPEPDAFLNDVTDFVLAGNRFNSINLESRDSSGFSSSGDSHGNSLADVTDASNLRDIIIDGSNVAMSHGKRFFSCKGIQIAVNWFKDRGHKNITAFVPQWRKETSRPDAPITDQEILSELEKEGIVVFTPARRVRGRRVVCYDDRFILKLAVETDGIVVSNDVYRDLVNEKEEFRKVVDQRLLMYSFVNDRFMPPEDPLGRLGPALDNFLRKVSVEPTPKPQDCPYGKKCTYGNKCRFYHPERGFAPQKLITETLKEQADLKLQERATRLSEIAEKGKRSKQKLSRTKSLVPWEPILPASQCAAGGTKSQQEKPKLAHSKSLMLPIKSCDYLNESRKRLEEAELTAAREKMSVLHDSFIQQFPAQAILPDDSDSLSKSQSQRSSPVLQKDVTKQAVTSGDILSKTSFPVKSVGTSSPLPSPSHLTVPKPETPERYLSGHLYLAKKLSDESVESNFFSEHTSSPSSTRTSSPVVPLSKIPEQTHPKKRQMDVAGSFTSPPPFHPSLLYQQHASYSPQTGSLDFDNIPHLSIFEQGMPHFSQRRDSTDTSQTYKQENVDSAHGGYMCSKINPLSPDSGPYGVADPFLNTYKNPQLSNSLSFSRAEQPHQSTERLNLRRAVSSTGNVKTLEDFHQKLGRRASGFSPPRGGENLYMTKPQCVSLEKSSGYQFGHFSDLNRQNSSSDPQMHAVSAGELQDVLSPFFPFGNSARNFSDPHSSGVQHYQTQQQQHVHFDNQQLQQQEALRSQLSKPRMNIWADSSCKSNVGQRSSVGMTTQNHYNPLESHNTVHTPHFTPTTANPNRMMTSIYTTNAPYLTQPQYHHQPQMMYTAQLEQSSENMFSAARRQSCPSHYTYPQFHHSVPVNPTFGYSDNHQNTSTGPQASTPLFLPEDAPIIADDPRYTIYFHLSHVFPERYVRKVMNQYPNERNPDTICKRLSKYKEQIEM